jgi:hypothetical protein
MRFVTVTGIVLFAIILFAPFSDTSHILCNADYNLNLLHDSKAAEASD